MQVFIFAAAGALVYAALREAPVLTTSVLHAGVFMLFAAAIGWRLFAAAALTPPPTRLAAPAIWPIYTILCPLYREANVLADLTRALERLDYPRHALDVKLLIEEDDQDTLDAAQRLQSVLPIEIIVLPPRSPRTKPKALNAGLARARGEYIVVYDAEDRPHPQQLRAALAAFAAGGDKLACLQAPLTVDNADASWIARQFALEYAIQFTQVLPLLARLGLPMPLGGSSNHFRTAALRAAHGWDSYNVTEDADLGYRLARDGWRGGVIAPPTYEEAPASLGAWLNQRTRWLKGHMLTWLVLMRNPFRSAREMGLAAFASMQLILGGGIVAALAHGPLACVVVVAALSPYDLLSPADFILAVFGYSVAVFAAMSACVLTGEYKHARAAFTMPLYWPLASLAAYRALFELLLRPHHWSKTKHGVSERRQSEASNPASASTSAAF